MATPSETEILAKMLDIYERIVADTSNNIRIVREGMTAETLTDDWLERFEEATGFPFRELAKTFE